MAKVKSCKFCEYWRRDWEWEIFYKSDEAVGDCYHSPPVLCQTLIPEVIRKSGYGLLRKHQRDFQMRPLTSSDDFCSNFKNKEVKK